MKNGALFIDTDGKPIFPYIPTPKSASVSPASPSVKPLLSERGFATIGEQSLGQAGRSSGSEKEKKNIQPLTIKELAKAKAFIKTIPELFKKKELGEVNTKISDRITVIQDGIELFSENLQSSGGIFDGAKNNKLRQWRKRIKDLRNMVKQRISPVTPKK